MAYSSMAIVALFVHFIVNYDIIMKKNDIFSKQTYKKYRLFLFSVMLYYIVDALWGIFYEYHLITLCYIDTILYFLLISISLVLWTRYMLVYLNLKNFLYKFVIVVGWLFLSFTFVILVINLFTPIFFYFENDAYQSGILRYVFLFVQLVLFLLATILAIIYTFKSRGKIRLRHRTIAFFGIAMTLLIVGQTLYPLMPLYSLGFLVGTCLLHTFVLEDEKKERSEQLEELIKIHDIKDKELYNTKLIAYTDALTGLKNMAAYNEERASIDKLISINKKINCAVIMFDLNNLKTVNDTFGHETGDNFIKRGSEIITSSFPNSQAFRIGGDEFLVFLEKDDYINRYELIESFEKQMDENLKNGDIVISSGLAEYDRNLDRDTKTIIARADTKMYNRKHILKERQNTINK